MLFALNLAEISEYLYLLSSLRALIMPHCHFRNSLDVLLSSANGPKAFTGGTYGKKNIHW